jgi:hypothetical protein
MIGVERFFNNGKDIFGMDSNITFFENSHRFSHVIYKVSRAIGMLSAVYYPTG